MSKLLQTKINSIHKQGQSIWLDYIDKNLVDNGGLNELVSCGIRGITSNPSIFQKAMMLEQDYSSEIQNLLKSNENINGHGLYHDLTLRDIRGAADILSDVYHKSNRTDGYVSLEVPPSVAHNPNETLKAARKLWDEVKRPNLMIKVPATMEGIIAIEILTSEGINVNATLIFSEESYEAVFQAYIRGLAQNPEPDKVASVASCFISRIDSKVDALLDQLGIPEALALKGKIAIANASRIYQRFLAIRESSDFIEQQVRGARLQRPLWASTSVKNPDYHPLLYVDQLIAPATVNTVPMKTLDAMAQSVSNEKIQPAIMNFKAANKKLSNLSDLGIDLHQVCAQLEVEGVHIFSKAYNSLIESLQDQIPVPLSG